MIQKKFLMRPIALWVSATIALSSIVVSTPAVADSPIPRFSYQEVQAEFLDRGLVAAHTRDGVFLSWRLLGSEVTGATSTGVKGSDFNVYRDGQPLATVTDSTNFLDQDASGAASYSVAAISDGIESERSAVVAPHQDNYLEIALNKPADGFTPSGDAYSYTTGDMSVGDVDGDGQYEYFVKWDPTNAMDVSLVGYTGTVYVDAYRADGTQLYRIDMGPNIRAGEHYTQFMVYDFDGDGRSEMMMKTAPGTKTVSMDNGIAGQGHYVTILPEDIKAGYANDDDYRVSPSDYYQHIVTMFEGWANHPEVIAGRWPVTLEEAFGIPNEHAYPLSRASAESLADHFMDVYAPSRSTRNDLRSFEGFILSGPEYLTVFDGASGQELQTIAYEPGRGDDGLMWGDYAYPRIEPGNRVDRFLAGVAYLDGHRPSALFGRGYYTRANLVAYDWNGEEISTRWSVDTGWVPMSNPFNDTPHGRDGTSAEYRTLTNQGFHSLTAADVDGDGKQEIVYGSATIDDDGSLLYSSFGKLPEGSAAPGENVRLGHGDQLHVTDIDPSRPGVEIFGVHENGTGAPYGYAMRDAATGAVLHGGYTGRDTGRGTIGDIDPRTPGIETWAVGLWSATGQQLSTSTPSTNFGIKWGADMTTQTLNWSSGTQTIPVIDDQVRGRLLAAEGAHTVLGTRAVPGLAADVLGDWREEVLLGSTDSTSLRVYFSTELSNHKLYTLMHDVQYRAEVARQNTTYNQPSYTSFYFASDMDFENVPVPNLRIPSRPIEPTSVTSTAGDARARISWDIPSVESNPANRRYTVTSASGDLTCITTANSCVIENLKNGKAYSFTVVAENSVGVSDPVKSNFVTPSWAPGTDQVSASVSAKTQCVGGKAAIAVHVMNKEAFNIDARIRTVTGESKKSGIKPAAAAYEVLAANVVRLEDSVVNISTYKWVNGSGHYTVYEAGYAGIDCR